jgi:hypothetical protein
MCIECAPKLKYGAKSFVFLFVGFWILIILVMVLKFALGVN